MGLLDDDETRELLSEWFRAGQPVLPQPEYLATPFGQYVSSSVNGDTTASASETPPGEAPPRLQYDPEECKFYAPDAKTQKYVLDRLNKDTTAQYGFDAKGYLQITGPAPADGRKRSATYAERIEAIINSPQTMRIDKNSRYTKVDPATGAQSTGYVSDHGGEVTQSRGYPSDAQVTVSGAGYSLPQSGNAYLPQSSDDVLLHGLGVHGAAAVAGPPPGVTPIDLENKIRSELGRPLREPEPQHGWYSEPPPSPPPQPPRRRGGR